MTVSKVASLYTLTKQIISKLDAVESGSLKREDTIEDITHLIEKRQEMITEIKPPYDKQAQKLGREIVQLNEILEEKMHQIFNSIKKDMSTIKQHKSRNRTYINPYGKLRTTDGMYVDSKQ